MRARNSFIALTIAAVLTAAGAWPAVGADPPNAADDPAAVERCAGEESVSRLKQALLGESKSDGVEAAYKLRAVAGKDFGSFFGEFIGKLKSSDVTERRAAAVALGRLCRAGDRRIWEAGIYEESLEALGAVLEDSDAQFREAAAGALVIIFDMECADAAPVAEAFRKALGDSHRPVRIAALQAIGLGGLREFLPEVIALFHDPDAEIRRQAAVSAGKLSEMTWFERVGENVIADHTDPQTAERLNRRRQIAVEYSPKAVAGLMELATDANFEIRVAAIEALGRNWGEAIRPAAETLKAAIRDKDEFVRAAAADSLRVLGKQATPSLLIALEDEESWVAQSAARSLGEIHEYCGPAPVRRIGGPVSLAVEGPENQASAGSDRGDPPAGSGDGEPKPEEVDESTRSVATALANILADPRADEDLRETATEALERIGPGAGDAAEVVGKTLADEDDDIRSMALRVLHSIGPAAKGQIPAIAAVIRSRPKCPPKTQDSSRHANPFDDNSPEDPFSDTDDDRSRFNAVCTLDEIARDAGSAQAVIPPLAYALGDWDADTARRAAEALARRGDAALPTLMEAIDSDDVLRRRSGAYAISLLEKKTPAAVPRLTTLLKDEDADVIRNAAQALASIAPSNAETVSALIVALDHRDGHVRIESAQALGAIGPDAARPAVPRMLKMFLESRDWRVRSVAIDALTKIGVDRESAARLSRVELADEPGLTSDIFTALLDHPDLALAYLKHHPFVLSRTPPGLLVRIIEDKGSESKPLRQAVLESDRLPCEVMAWVGDPRYIPVLKNRMEDAGLEERHSRAYLEACARACGAEPGRVLTVSKEHRGDGEFWLSRLPDEPRRMPLRFVGYRPHEIALICATGRITGKDGAVVAEPRFLNFHDRTPLGARFEDSRTLKYNPESGRFVLFSRGPTHVLIEAKGYEPLDVILHGEMPDVLITLEPEK